MAVECTGRARIPPPAEVPMRQTIACTLAALLASSAAEAQTTRPVPRQEPTSPAAARPDAPVMAEGQARPGLPVVRLIATGGAHAVKNGPGEKGARTGEGRGGEEGRTPGGPEYF